VGFAPPEEITMGIGTILIILFLALLPVVFMFAVDWRLNKIYKELRTLNATFEGDNHGIED